MDSVDGVTSSFFGKRKRMPLICTALGLILCFDLVRRRKLLARRVVSSSFVKELISWPTINSWESSEGSAFPPYVSVIGLPRQSAGLNLLLPCPAGGRTRPLLRELPAHDAQQSLDRGIVEVRLQPDVDRRPMSRTHLLVDDSRHCEICDTGWSQGYTGPGGHQAHYGWPLWSFLHNIWPEPFCFAT